MFVSRIVIAACFAGTALAVNADTTVAERRYLQEAEMDAQNSQLYEVQVMLAHGRMQDTCPEGAADERACLRRVRAVANIVGCAFFEDIVERVECYDRAAGRALTEGPWDFPQRE